MWLISILFALCTFIIGFVVGYAVDLIIKVKDLNKHLNSDEEILKWWHSCIK